MALFIAIILVLLAGISGSYLGYVIATKHIERQNKKLLETYQHNLQTYREVLDRIRRDRMLFTRHPKFRETANLISRLCS